MTTTAKTTTNTVSDVQEQYAHTAQTMAKHLAAAQAAQSEVYPTYL